MITERGKTILGKYMAGQNESTFSYLAIGIGAKPAFSTNIVEQSTEMKDGDWYPETNDGTKWWYKKYNQSVDNIYMGFVPEYDKVSVDYNNGTGIIRYSDMKELDYEVLRVPITESGVEFVQQLVGANLGTSDGPARRYAALTDIILTGTLPSLGEYRFTEIGIYSAQANAIASSKPSEVLFNFTNVTESWVDNESAAIELKDGTPADLGFYKSDNPSFVGGKTQARPRAGQFCLYLTNGTTIVHDASMFNFTQVRPDDQFRLAYFFINPLSPLLFGPLDIARVIFTDKGNNSVSAVLTSNEQYFSRSNDCIPTTYEGNKYGVAFAKVSDFVGSPDFSWSNVSTISIQNIGMTTDVFLDSIKYVSTNHNNPNYGLVSYSVVQNKSGLDGTTAIPDSLHKAKDLETLLQYRVRIIQHRLFQDFLIRLLILCL
jgi:hypothetical protein